MVTSVMPNGGEEGIVYDAGPQPGGREPAPWRLGLVQAFVNSWYDLEHEHGAELLSDPPALGHWLARRGLVAPGASVSAAELHRALALRAGLRALLIANNGGELDRDAVVALDAAAAHAPVTIGLAGGDRPELRAAAAGVDGALALVLAGAARAMLDGSWDRFKACRQHDCRWAFYDHSRNGAGNWCSMAVCGGRAKQRAYYRRRR